jgi:hypothetical protein
VGARAMVVAGLLLIAAAYLFLSAAPADAGYFADLLPGYVPLGFGVGLAFVGVQVTAMAEVEADRAGLGSGLMTTAHEVGAAFGIALFSSVALGAGGAIGHGFAGGYGDGSLAGAALAGLLAALALATVPAYRPAAHAAAPMHH